MWISVQNPQSITPLIFVEDHIASRNKTIQKEIYHGLVFLKAIPTSFELTTQQALKEVHERNGDD
jgi:hypothetical protein